MLKPSDNLVTLGSGKRKDDISRSMSPSMTRNGSKVTSSITLSTVHIVARINLSRYRTTCKRYRSLLRVEPFMTCNQHSVVFTVNSITLTSKPGHTTTQFSTFKTSQRRTEVKSAAKLLLVMALSMLCHYVKQEIRSMHTLHPWSVTNLSHWVLLPPRPQQSTMPKLLTISS
jgi:hypothetical protein